MDIMRYLSFLLSIALLLVARHTAYAINSVNITNSGNGTSETHIKIETDGEVKSFDTTDGENVDWTSDDGKSTVKITTNTKGSTPTPSSQPKAEVKDTDNDKSDTVTLTPIPTKGDDKITEKNQSFSLFDLFKNIFAFFGFGKSQ